MKGRRKKRVMPRPKQTARELYAMVEDARQGIPPATSSGDRLIDEAQKAGDFSRALKLREEVKERVGDIRRIADAQAKRERRAARQ